MRWIFALTLLCLGFAPVPPAKRDANRRDLRAIQGEWILQEQFFRGRPFVNDDGCRVEVIGNRLRYLSGKKVTAEYRVTVDATVTPPRFTFQGIGEAGSCRGLYRVEHDTLIICYDAGGGDYPKSLTDQGRHVYREVFKRKRP